MNNWLQYLLVGVIVAIAVVAAVRSAVGAAKGKKTALTACASCKLKDVCQKPEKNSAKNVPIKLHRSKIRSNFAPLFTKGRLDEWFSHRSAKPGTAVRVR